MKKILTAMCALLVAGCQQASFSLANLPAHFGSERVVKDISFGADEEQKLDIYMPAQADKNSQLPVIVFFYGGRWTSGEKEQYAFAAHALLQKGFVVVVPDYRKYPSVKFPVFVEDGAATVAWVYDHIAEYNGDRDNIFVAGHSSGAHIGALISSDPRYLNKNIIKGFAGLAGPYNFTPDEPDLVDMFGPPDRYPQMQVTTFIDGTEPPMLLLWGTEDVAVGRFNLDKLEARIKEKGGRVAVKIYSGINHVWILGALSWVGGNKAPVLDDITMFFKDIIAHEQ